MSCVGLNYFAEFDMKIIHCPGKSNVADALSRNSVQESDCTVLASSEVSILSDPEVASLLEHGYNTDPFMKTHYQ